jgi:photosystem II stability/assembly factor-like uncharacterized protein
VNGIARSPDYDGYGSPALYLATEGGGVWRTTQFGDKSPLWQPLTDFVPTPVEWRTRLSEIQSITVDPHDPQVLYAGSGVGVLRTRDGGATWSLIPTSPVEATRIIVDARPNRTGVWACGEFGLRASPDGNVWAAAGIGGFGLVIFKVDDLEWTVSADGKTFTIYAGVRDVAQGSDGSRNGIYSTTDEGVTWAKMPIVARDHDSGQLVSPAAFGKISLGTDHSPGSVVQPVAAISKDTGDWRRAPVLNVFMLKDGAWEPIGSDLPNALDTQSGANQPITVTASGAVYFAVSGNWNLAAVFQTLDSGGHWSDITTANGVEPHHDHHCLLFMDGALYDGNDGGIWRYTPATWQPLNTAGLQTIQVQGVAIHPTDPSILLEGSQDNGTARLVGGVWEWVQQLDRGRVRYAPGTKDAYSVAYNYFDHSSDEGATWGPVALPLGEFAAEIMLTYEVDPYGTGRILMVGLHGTWLSSDTGTTWKKIAPALTGEPNGVTAMAFSPISNTIYLAFDNGKIFRTVNEGKNGVAADWTEISAGTAFGGKAVALATDPASADGLYLITDGRTVWRTTNAGGVWQNLTSDLPAIQLNALTLASRPNDPHVFVGTSSGVYVCPVPANPHWRRLGAGFPYVSVTDLSYQPYGDVLAAGTYGRGVFEAPLGDLLHHTVHIHWPQSTTRDGCPLALVEGQTLSVSCQVDGVSDPAGFTYVWTVGSARLAAGEGGTAFSIQVILPSPPAQVNLSVVVSDMDGFVVGTDTRGLVPEPMSAAAAAEFMCHLKHIYMKLPFFLWPGDPARDVIRRPITEGDLRSMLRIAQQMVETAQRGLLFIERTEDPTEVERIPQSSRAELH